MLKYFEISWKKLLPFTCTHTAQHTPQCLLATPALALFTRKPSDLPMIWQRKGYRLALQDSAPGYGRCPIYLVSVWTYRFFFLILFIYFWLHRVFIAARGLSLVAASGGHSSLRCVGFSLWWLLLLRSTGSRCTGFSSCGSRAQ